MIILGQYWSGFAWLRKSNINCCSSVCSSKEPFPSNPPTTWPHASVMSGTFTAPDRDVEVSGCDGQTFACISPDVAWVSAWITSSSCSPCPVQDLNRPGGSELASPQDVASIDNQSNKQPWITNIPLRAWSAYCKYNSSLTLMNV